jgi:hypothetical protein
MDAKWLPAEVTGMEMVVGGDMKKLLPPYTEIPQEFHMGSRGKWNRFVSDWFFCGLKDLKVTPKAGIDQGKALRHIKAIMASWEPQHEHKEAGCAYLASLWFEDVQYNLAKEA